MLAAALAVAGCGGTRTLDPRTWFKSGEETAAPKAREEPGVEARLQPLGSSVSGIVRARESGDLLIVRVELHNVKPGTLHRVVFHANGNCSSPNGFSAGAPWAPPGAKETPARLVPDVYTNSDGTAIMTARLRGVRAGSGEAGFEKRAVLIYEGANTEPPKPSVANNVIACGVFTKSTSLFAP
jgi:Cu/Zn superoxide dismutase